MKMERSLAMKNPRCHVILNPTAGSGKAGREASRILAALRKSLGCGYTLYITRKPLDATAIAREVILDGAEFVVAVGGDGTIQEVVNGFFINGRLISLDCQLGIINTGTGHGFAQSLGLPADIEGQCEIVASGEARRLDIGRAFFANGNGEPGFRYFVNECQAGIGGVVVENVRSQHKRLGGTLAFGLKTLTAALGFPEPEITVSIDGRPGQTGRFIGVVAANGRFTAGGMRLTPQADVGDGLLDFLFIKEQTLLERLKNFPKIYSGRHLGSPHFNCLQGKTLSLASEQKVLFEADGELLGCLPCDIRICPAVLPVRAAISNN
jgi:YegS/Rv2252/BmrU family lipid kinase